MVWPIKIYDKKKFIRPSIDADLFKSDHYNMHTDKNERHFIEPILESKCEFFLKCGDCLRVLTYKLRDLPFEMYFMGQD